MALHDGIPALPVVGATLAGKYRIERIIGAGGMGVVFEATHVRIGQRVAIKMLQPRTLEAPDLVARFEREARAAGQLRSPHTARVTDVDVTDDGLPYLVMEFLEGNDLAAELEHRHALPIAEAVGYVLQAASAMAEAHACGIIHRDLKPSNLFLAREGDRVFVKVLDFGISKVAPLSGDDASVTSTLASMGTPLYMPPEQVRSAKSVDARSDVWSLGVILFELLAGRPPFLGESLMAVSAAIIADRPPRLCDLRPDVPPVLENIVLRALEKSPSARWESMNAIAAALAPFAGPDVRPVFGSAASGVVSSRAPLHSGTLAASAITPARPTGSSGSKEAKTSPRPASTRSWLMALASVPVLGLLAFGVTHHRGAATPAFDRASSGASPTSLESPGTSVVPSEPAVPASTLVTAPSLSPSASASVRPSVPAHPPVRSLQGGPVGAPGAKAAAAPPRSVDSPASNPIRL